MRTSLTALVVAALGVGLFSSPAAAQGNIPQKILDELQTRNATRDGTSYAYRIVYPKHYGAKKNAKKKYAVALGLSGGPASERIVDYCYYTMFRSRTLAEYILVLPISKTGGFRSITAEEAQSWIAVIRKNERARDRDWLLLGSSNGGFGAFHVAAADPGRFAGVIVMPGGLAVRAIPKKWSPYRVVLAVGERDTQWKRLMEQTAQRLRGKVKSVQTFVMKGQGHIVSPAYDIDQVYKLWFPTKAGS